MILVIILFGDLLTRVSSTDCYEGCFCYSNTMNCSKQSLIEVPTDISESINNLDLAYNRIFQVKSEELFQNLEYLDLSHNRIRIIKLDLRKSSLETLKLSDNPINQIEINSTTLKILNISLCDITYLQQSLLDKLPSLEILDINHNPLKKLQPLSGNLKELYLQGCLLNDVIFDLPQLQLLDISYNRQMKILKLQSNLTILKAAYGSIYQAELTLPKLQILDLSHNKLSQISFNNPNLEELNLSWNSLRSLKIYLIDTVLWKLDLSHNLLYELELSLKTLLFLNVSFNPLTTLSVYSRSLTMVDCASCQLKKFNLPIVHTLNLSRNGLEDFIGEATSLDLSHNLLDTFSGKAKFVDLRGNRLSLPKKVSVTGSALLGNNPWLCKCDDSALKELYMKAVDREVTCASPEGKTWNSCFTTKLPKYMKDYPWVPLVASGVLTALVVICIYTMKVRLLGDRSSASPPSHDIEEISQREPFRERIEDRPPSYEEALLMNKPRYNNRRSYEIVPNRRASSSSI